MADDREILQNAGKITAEIAKAKTETEFEKYCDIEDGCEFKTAKELFEAKIYDKRSIKDRWDELVLINIGGISADDWEKSWFD